uniref:UTP25 small subunit processome component n=1 Tax=Sarcophilus harrisii TaxID=9305 RepID=G3WET1_SARHA
MGKRRNRSRSQSQVLSSLSKKQKKHLRDFGEEHPFYDKVSGKDAKPQICKLAKKGTPRIKMRKRLPSREQLRTNSRTCNMNQPSAWKPIS